MSEKYPRDEQGRFLPGVHQPNRIPAGEQGREQAREMALKKWEKFRETAIAKTLERLKNSRYDIGPNSPNIGAELYGEVAARLYMQTLRLLDEDRTPAELRDMERPTQWVFKAFGFHPDQEAAKQAKIDITTKGPSQILITGQTMDALNAQMEQIRRRDVVDTEAEEVDNGSVDEDGDEVDS